MSVKHNEKQNPRGEVTSKQRNPDPKINGLSPDDSIDVKPPPDQPPACPGPSQQ